MEKRPRIHVPLSHLDRFLIVSNWLLICVLFIIVFVQLPTLPEQIPVHYNAAGEADAYGGKYSILFIPIMGLVISIGLSILTRYPHIFNYPVKITEANAARQYAYATQFLRAVCLSCTILFFIISIKTLYNAQHPSGTLGIWFLPVAMLLFFIPVIRYLSKALKAK
jgi:uncharacterized membrane protein